jgi:hypothetical protein
MYEADTGGGGGGIGLRHYNTGAADYADVYSPANRMLTYVNRWVHVAATLNGHQDGNNCTLYIDGAPVNSARTRLSNGPDPNIFLTIGNTMDQNAWPNGPEGFYGYIDEVRIYNRALEANEVAYLADTTPGDGLLSIPVPSLCEVYTSDPVGQNRVDFKDFALVARKWLMEDLYP